MATMTRVAATILVLLTLGSAGGAHAADRAAANFALIIGVNRSVDASAVSLRYADDDAARYRDLFHAVGAGTYLLTSLDENTARLHPLAAGEAAPPRVDRLREVVGRLAGDVARAQRAGRLTNLYVLYAGHGNVEKDTGYITLEDAKLTGADLAREVLDRVRADRKIGRAHV